MIVSHVQCAYTIEDVVLSLRDLKKVGLQFLAPSVVNGMDHGERSTENKKTSEEDMEN